VMAASRRIFRIAVWSGLLASPAIRAASPLKFDCDVPADRFASVSQETAGPLAISGTVALILAREGKYLPVAGARLVSSDESRSVGFQLIAPSAHRSEFNIIFNVNTGDGPKRYTVGQVDLQSPAHFSLAISDAGKISLAIGDKSFDGGTLALSGGKIVAFCSTGQFKFSDLNFSNPAEPSPAPGN
jgi:hypothetical protein